VGIKSRGNWAVGICMKGDCINRDKQCDDCIRFSCYERNRDVEKPSDLPDTRAA
jgi:hypothetical protein